MVSALLLCSILSATLGAEGLGGSPEPALHYSGMTLSSSFGRVEVRQPGKPGFEAPSRLPLPLGVGMGLRTGALSRALLELEDGGSIGLSAQSAVEIGNPSCRLESGRLRAAATPRRLVVVETAPVPVRVVGRGFSIVMPGKGKGKTAALGDGRPTAAKLIAAKGFVEVQLPFGTIRAADLPLTLHEGSVVQTAANSFAVLAFPDGSLVKLRADSTGSVDSEHRCTVAAGAADVHVPPAGRLEVRTIDRRAWVRGAAFVVETLANGESAQSREGSAEALADAESPDAPLPGAAGWDVSH